jgi:hypothetical protein
MTTTLEDLRKKHNEIKRHPYRENFEDKYVAGYKELLYRLGDFFYDVVKETKYKASTRFIHDYNLYIGNLDRDSKSLRDFAGKHTDMCIGVIHTFIDTGEVLFYYDTFKHPKTGERKSVKITFNENTGMYEGFINVEEV